jgi:hypothetical protein
MENPDMNLSAKDYALRITKGALGAVPFAGGLLGELLEIAIYPKQQKKLTEWFEYVDSTLNQLIKQGEKTKEQIFNDEEFLSIFQKTSRIYTSNVEKHKKPILQSFLKASINKEIPLDKKYIFLRIIEELNEAQLLILRDIYENEKSDKYLFQNKIESVLSEKYANSDDKYLALLIKGLQDFHLLSYTSANTVVDGKNQWHMRTSKIANELFEYLLTE